MKKMARLMWYEELVCWIILKFVRRTKPLKVSVVVSVATCVGALTSTVRRTTASPFSSVVTTSDVTKALVPGVTKRKSPWKTSKRIWRLRNLMPFNTAVTTTRASPPLQIPLPQPVPVGESGVIDTVLLRVLGLTVKVTGTVAPRLSRTVMMTGVSALTLFGITVILKPDVADPVTTGAGITTGLLLPVVYGAVPPLMLISVGKSANTSATASNTPKTMTGGAGGVVGVVLAAPPPPHELSKPVMALKAAMTTAYLAQLPVLLK